MLTVENGPTALLALIAGLLAVQPALYVLWVLKRPRSTGAEEPESHRREDASFAPD